MVVPHEQEENSTLTIESIVNKGFDLSKIEFAFCCYCKQRVIEYNNEGYNEDNLEVHDCRTAETDRKFMFEVLYEIFLQSDEAQMLK
jgi:hypothetical protein